jgi:hypothetical protein
LLCYKRRKNFIYGWQNFLKSGGQNNMNPVVLQSTTEGIFTMNMITVIEELLRYCSCPPCAPCPPCSRIQAKMNTKIDAKAAAGRVAILADTDFIAFIFAKAFPGVSFPAEDDPRVVAIKAAVDKMKAGG